MVDVRLIYLGLAALFLLVAIMVLFATLAANARARRAALRMPGGTAQMAPPAPIDAPMTLGEWTPVDPADPERSVRVSAQIDAIAPGTIQGVHRLGPAPDVEDVVPGQTLQTIEELIRRHDAVPRHPRPEPPGLPFEALLEAPGEHMPAAPPTIVARAQPVPPPITTAEPILEMLAGTPDLTGDEPEASAAHAAAPGLLPIPAAGDASPAELDTATLETLEAVAASLGLTLSPIAPPASAPVALEVADTHGVTVPPDVSGLSSDGLADPVEPIPEEWIEPGTWSIEPTPAPSLAEAAPSQVGASTWLEPAEPAAPAAPAEEDPAPVSDIPLAPWMVAAPVDAPLSSAPDAVADVDDVTMQLLAALADPVVAVTPEPVPSDEVPPAPRPAATIAPPRFPEPAPAPAPDAVTPAPRPTARVVDTVPSYTMVAPIELSFADGPPRVGIRPGTPTYLKYQRLAAVLLTDLRKAKGGL
ncbi:MAG: hypothetical protein Q7W30_03410 [Coriobacteriia bacterium]|nr:hypothetical protein [Coriobacteriia bacterium]